MAALEQNHNSRAWAKLGEDLPRPRAILCVSAHWETRGTAVTAMPRPKTIHDFYGFPKELYALQYPAPGDQSLASQIAKDVGASLDTSWGLDHGCWTVLYHMYPKADIPVLQLSLDRGKTPEEHLELGKKLRSLRDQGVLILGTGNVVHNLRYLDMSGRSTASWAKNVDIKVRSLIQARQFDDLVRFRDQGPDFDLAINSAEHYLPLLYILGASDEGDSLKVLNDRIDLGAVSMTSYLFGA